MTPVFIFVISLVANSGQMEMKAYYVEKCPDKVAFETEMNQRLDNGEFKDWHALCVPQKKEGQDT